MSAVGEQDLFRSTTRRFLESTTPVGHLRSLEDERSSFDRSWWRKGADLGWCAMLAPESAGGGSVSGEGLLDLVIAAEEMGRVVAPGPFIPVNVAVVALGRSDSAEHRELLARLVAGDAIVTFAVQSGDGGWDGSGAPQASPSNGGFVLEGTAVTVEAADGADHIVVVGRTGAGMTQFLVPTNLPGLTFQPQPGLDLGRRYSSATFSGAEVPGPAVVGKVGEAAVHVEEQLALAVTLQMAETVGVMSRVFESTCEYLGNRYSFGRRLNSYQALKHRVADMKMWLEASAALARSAAVALQRREPDRHSVVSAAKAYIGDKSTDLVQDCVQMHGGIGVTWEHDLHLYLRRVTVNRFLYGTPEQHRDRLAALAGL